MASAPPTSAPGLVAPFGNQSERTKGDALFVGSALPASWTSPFPVVYAVRFFQSLPLALHHLARWARMSRKTVWKEWGHAWQTTSPGRSAAGSGTRPTAKSGREHWIMRQSEGALFLVHASWQSRGREAGRMRHGRSFPPSGQLRHAGAGQLQRNFHQNAMGCLARMAG